MINTLPNESFFGQTPRLAIEEVLRNLNTILFSIDRKEPLAIQKDRFEALPGRAVVDVYDFISFAEDFDGNRLPFIFKSEDADIRLLKIGVEYRRRILGLPIFDTSEIRTSFGEGDNDED